MSDDSAHEQLEEIIAYYKCQREPSAQENLVALLREIQGLLNCIPEDVQEAVSNALSVKRTVITHLIKLYPSLTASPSRIQITVCLGPRCISANAQEILNDIRNAICQKPFRLTIQNCLKQCGTAPNIRIGNDLYQSVKKEDIEQILQKYQDIHVGQIS